MKRPAPDLTPRPAGRKRATGPRVKRGGPRNVAPAALPPSPDPSMLALGAAAPVESDDPVSAKLRDRCAKKMTKLHSRILENAEKQKALANKQRELHEELREDLAALAED